jgi:hypothetical protein
MSTPQHMQALALAQEVRIAGDRFCMRVRKLSYPEGCEILASILEERDIESHIGALYLDRFLKSIRFVGDHGVEEIWQEAGMLRRNVRVRELVLSERSRLAGALRARAESGKGRPPK